MEHPGSEYRVIRNNPGPQGALLAEAGRLNSPALEAAHFAPITIFDLVKRGARHMGSVRVGMPSPSSAEAFAPGPTRRYLHQLPVRPAPSARRTRSRVGRPIGTALGVLALLAISSLGAIAVGRMGSNLPSGVLPGWSASGCLAASVEPMGGLVVLGQASLCIGDSGLHGTADLEHLEPLSRYVEWMAYFDSPSLCSFGRLIYQVPSFTRPCTLDDLNGPAPRGVVRGLAEATTDTRGVLHIDGAASEINLLPHTQAWLLVSRPAWSPTALPASRHSEDPAAEVLARASFDVP